MPSAHKSGAGTCCQEVGVERTQATLVWPSSIHKIPCKPATTRTSEQKLAAMAHAPKLLSLGPYRRKTRGFASFLQAESCWAWQAFFRLSLDPNALTCLSNFEGKRITVARNTLKYQYFSQLIFSVLNGFCVLAIKVGEKLQKAYKRSEYATRTVSTSLHAP
jgi:hypothetical protein